MCYRVTNVLLYVKVLTAGVIKDIKTIPWFPNIGRTIDEPNQAIKNWNDWSGPEDDPASIKSNYVPVIFTEDRDPNHWLHPVKEASNTFEISADVANPRGFILKPFYATHERRYSVYWDIYNEQQLNQHQSELEAELKRKQELEAKTLDFFQPGDE